MKSFLSVAMALCLGLPAVAQDQPAPISLELNTLTQLEGACRMVFTAQAAAPVEQLVAETVLFDAAGSVTLLTLFDFRDLPATKVRVRQFDIPAAQCNGISRVLFNGLESCSGAGCASGLAPASRVDGVEVLG